MKVAEEVAEKEIERWLDARLTSDKKKNDMADSIRELVSAVVEGNLIVNENGTLTQKLIIPFGEESVVKEVNYKLRISAGDIQKRMTFNKIKQGDIDGRLMVHVCAATNLSFEQVGKMDSADYTIASTIGNFFY